MSMNYDSFLANKLVRHEECGISVTTVSDILYPFQRELTMWALRKGRAAIFADCGLGKTLIQLEWLRQIHDQGYAQYSLIVAPLSVCQQTVREAENKLGVHVNVAHTKQDLTPGMNTTNYEMLRSFIGADLDAIVLDESSILKSIDGKTRKLILDHFSTPRFRLCCTATPCPNDIAELANHSQFLGIMTRGEMLATFFVHDEEGWRLRGHAHKDFYRWLASWAMVVRNPSDIGFDDNGFLLPSLYIVDEIVESDWRKDGHLFAGDLKGITDRASVRRHTLEERTQRATSIANSTDEQVIVWCGLNDESALAARLIPHSIEVKGGDSHDAKLAAIAGFLDGTYRVLVTKPKICGFGLNLQNASRMVFLGLGDSYESYYQCIRRCWRYGQHSPVHVHVVVTDHEQSIVENVRRKEREADALMGGIMDEARSYERDEIKQRQWHEILERRIEVGPGWTLRQGDCVEELKHLADNSIDLSIFSPPFGTLYQYSSAAHDMGNCVTTEQFLEHFRYAIDELQRKTKPGRNCCVHLAGVATTLSNHGVIGLYDLRGDVIRAFVAHGWIFHGEITIDKNPQAQAVRTHAKGLLFLQLRKDASWLRPGLADYICVFRKPGENLVPIQPDLTNDEWIELAHPVWYNIRENDTLNVNGSREEEDDRHICPLQLETIRRCVRLWSNPGELILSPFAGIGSEGYVALQEERRFVGIELKPIYVNAAVRNLRAAVSAKKQIDLFDVEPCAASITENINQ